MKKALALILALVLAVGMLAGCGGKGGNSGKDGGEAITELTLPLSKDKAELSVWTIYSGTIVSDLNDIAGVKKMEEMTNVHINWIPVEQQQGGDKFGLLLTSDDLPDIINYNSYPGGLEKGITDGVIRSLIIRKPEGAEIPVQEAAEEAPAEETPAEEAPAEEAPVEEAAAEEAAE